MAKTEQKTATEKHMRSAFFCLSQKSIFEKKIYVAKNGSAAIRITNYEDRRRIRTHTRARTQTKNKVT